MDAAAFGQVYGAFGDFHAYFASLFGRRETRDHSHHYLQALLVQSSERRNAENLSETVPASARGIQRFLAESPWDDDTFQRTSCSCTFLGVHDEPSLICHITAFLRKTCVATAHGPSQPPKVVRMETEISTPEGTFKVMPQQLADVEVQLAPGSSASTLPCTVQQTLAPTPRTTVRYDLPDDSPPDIKMRLFKMQWNPGPIHALITHRGNNLGAQLMLRQTDPYVEFLIQKLEPGNDEDAKHTQEVGFKVINMKSPDLLGGYVSLGGGGWETFGVVVLIDDEWKIQLQQTPNHREAQRYLQFIGGYQITHIGSIFKNDGSLFSQEEAQEEINILRSFLSFCNGAFVGLTEIQGADQNWAPLWEVWKDHNVGWSNGGKNYSWIHVNGANDQENEMMASLFPSFSREYQRDKNLHSLVYRYLQANQTQPDIDPQTARVIGQTALKLALNAETDWKRLVPFPLEYALYQIPVSPARRSRASWNPQLEVTFQYRQDYLEPVLAQEIESYGVSLDIPDEMPNLRRLYKRNPPKIKGIKPGPSILSDVRNAHEHPEIQLHGTEEDYYTKALFEAWHLGQWYTEAVVLGRCSYAGRRTNCLRERFQAESPQEICEPGS